MIGRVLIAGPTFFTLLLKIDIITYINLKKKGGLDVYSSG